ncbi:uncharacterized protein B0P05DRAFT_560498 [Gilbertella persicaria]|uniref:uncharacterized protein n=1 Tax=Gilbertella persicaria TaxID=101096 RepID=UPI002220F93B|nr:uncharacterized protein B0P05DRAFT_560498 [Gilbertella persicaria]KAI8055555.1 hypothetical protein B0P05DRAFT_560498 [Gilbertella persicaria]
MRKEDKYKARIRSIRQAFTEDQRMFDHFWAQHSENLMKLVIENQVRKAAEKLHLSLKRSFDDFFTPQAKRRCIENTAQHQQEATQSQQEATQKQQQLTQRQPQAIKKQLRAIQKQQQTIQHQQQSTVDTRLLHGTTADSKTDHSIQPNFAFPGECFYKIIQATVNMNHISNDGHTTNQLTVPSTSDQQASSTPNDLATVSDQQPVSSFVTEQASAHQAPIRADQNSIMIDRSTPRPMIASQCLTVTVADKDKKENKQKEEKEAPTKSEEETEEEEEIEVTSQTEKEVEETTAQTEENDIVTHRDLGEMLYRIQEQESAMLQTKKQEEAMVTIEREEGMITEEQEEEKNTIQTEKQEEEVEKEQEEQTTPPTEKEAVFQNEEKEKSVVQVPKKHKIHHIKLADSTKKTRTQEEAQRKDIVEVDMLFYKERRSIGTILKRWAFTVHTALYHHKEPVSDLAKRNMAIALSSVLDLGQGYREPDSHGYLFGLDWPMIKKDLMAKSPLSVTKDEVKLLYDKQCRRKNIESVYHEIQSKTARESNPFDIANLWRILRHWLTLLRQKDSVLSGSANMSNIEYFHCLWSTIFQLLFPAAQKIRLKIGDLDHHHPNNTVFSFKLAVQVEGKEISLAVGECSTTHTPVEDRLIRKGKVALDDMIQLTGLSEDTRCMTWLIHITGLSCTLSTIELLANGLYVHIPRYSFVIPCSFSDVRLFGQCISDLVKMQHELRLALDLMSQPVHRPKHTKSHRSRKSGWIRDTWYAPQGNLESRIPTYFTKPPPLHRKMMMEEEDP